MRRIVHFISLARSLSIMQAPAEARTICPPLPQHSYDDNAADTHHDAWLSSFILIILIIHLYRTCTYSAASYIACFF